MAKNSLKGLNSSQTEAVSHREGPLLVLAGPGSGKTKVIAHRIAYLINELSVPPENILAVTFTNKAAKEMKKRARKLSGEPTSDIWIGTFHSVCLRILKTEAGSLKGYTKDFVVYDQDDQLGLLKSCMRELDIGDNFFPPRKALFEFDSVENKKEVRFKNDFYGLRLKELYDLYKKELVRLNAMTFNDLLLLANRVLSENPEVCARYQDKFSHVLVDEYQDTNISQDRLVKILSQRLRNLFVVGDDSQAIYGWRGADVNNILNFEKDFPGAKVVKLERNYRSTPAILGVANSVIRQNLGGNRKTVWTENPEGEKVLVFRAGDNEAEARFVAERIKNMVESGDYKRSDVAVLYRANFQSRVIEQELRAENIPHKVVSGVGFFRRAEIKDIIAYLRLVQNPKDDVSFERIVNVPPRKIGEATLQKLREASQSGEISLFEAVGYCREHDLLPQSALSALSRFVETIERLGSVAENQPLAHVIGALVENTRYLDYLKDEQRIENVKELLNMAEGQVGANLSDFLDHVLLSTDEDRADSEEEQISLMTIHAAKGTEFPAVFVFGVNEGYLPHAKSAETPGGLEEERRLFYVAITRAKRFLSLSYASRGSRGGGMYGEARRSDFLKGLPEEHVVYEPRRRGEKDFPEEHVVREYRRRRENLSVRDSSDYSDPPSKKKAREPNDAGLTLRAGKRVVHHIFGPGVIKRVEGKGEMAVVTVDFSGSGTKKIHAGFLSDPDSVSASDPPSEKRAPELKAADRTLRVGKKVTHQVFGSGVVKRIEGKGDMAVVTVDFSSSGTRKIHAGLLSY